MNFIIADGSTQNIIAGSKVKLVPGYLPEEFDGIWITITKLQATNSVWYPYAIFDGQESAISHEIISAVQ